MLNELVIKSGIPQKVLESEIQTVFQKYGTSEYAFVIQELPSLKAKHPGADLEIVYEDAIKAYRFVRKASLRLYSEVLETFQTLKKEKCLIVAFTESREFHTVSRIKKLGLDGILDYVYSPPDHAVPPEISREQARWYPDEHYKLQHTVHRFIPEGERKPNPSILLDIIDNKDISAALDKTIYVGDSLMKDISMAQDAHVTDVYAKYGTAQDTQAYELLRRVTHWTKEDVEREKAIYANRIIQPTFVLEKSFGELLDLFDFVSHTKQ